jgi:uncharacterized surface protein with fasciclin (FAS1) repeats
MKNLFAILFLGVFSFSTAFAFNNSGEENAPSIVGVASSNADFSTLVAAVKAADLVSTLDMEGPFTVFAPVNTAFDKLPEGTVASLLMPENKAKLTSILTYHVVKGEFKAADVIAAIQENDGKFKISTVQGGTLTAKIKDGNVVLKDENGMKSTVVITDVKASNGIIHAIDSVVMPMDKASTAKAASKSKKSCN